MKGYMTNICLCVANIIQISDEWQQMKNDTLAGIETLISCARFSAFFVMTQTL